MESGRPFTFHHPSPFRKNRLAASYHLYLEKVTDWRVECPFYEAELPNQRPIIDLPQHD